MSAHYPRLRLHGGDGTLALREGVVLCFFMKRSHAEVSGAVARALERYCAAVGRRRLTEYVDPEGEWQPLDEDGWAFVQQALASSTPCTLQLVDRADQVAAYEVLYHGQALESALNRGHPEAVTGVSFWLPTEEMETQGPQRIRELATVMARELPLCSGYASLAFQSLGLAELEETLLGLAMRYPGMDFLRMSSTVLWLGTQVRGAYWLNFYGPPLLESLGGAQGLRERLKSPGVEVEELKPGQQVLVSLGEWPEAGGEPSARGLEPYRELARVLEPWLYEDGVRWPGFWPPDMKRWMRRFLD